MRSPPRASEPSPRDVRRLIMALRFRDAQRALRQLADALRLVDIHAPCLRLLCGDQPVDVALDEIDAALDDEARRLERAIGVRE